MVQVENEIGMIPEARDWSAEATKLYHRAGAARIDGRTCDEHKDESHSRVPRRLGEDRLQNRAAPGKKSSAPASARKRSSWPGTSRRYTNRVAAAGKAEYPLPMFVNAALIRPGYPPGRYPSAGPLPHLMDVWRAAAPAIDFLSPDIYFPELRRVVPKVSPRRQSAVHSRSRPRIAQCRERLLCGRPARRDRAEPVCDRPHPGPECPTARDRATNCSSELAPLILEAPRPRHDGRRRAQRAVRRQPDPDQATSRPRRLHVQRHLRKAGRSAEHRPASTPASGSRAA